MHVKTSHSYIRIIRNFKAPNDSTVELVKFAEWLPKSPGLNPLCHDVLIELKGVEKREGTISVGVDVAKRLKICVLSYHRITSDQSSANGRDRLKP